MSTPFKNLFRQAYLNRTVQHLLFWCLSIIVLSLFFAQEYENSFSTINVLYTFLFHWSIWFLVYANLLFGIPKLLSTHQYFVYSIFLMLILFAGIHLNLFTFNVLADVFFPHYYFIAYYDWWDITVFLIVYLCLTSLLKLSRAWFLIAKKEQRISALEQEKSQFELSALKAQIHPHFLFNSLNNLYGLALEKDERTPDIILQMSRTMRYVLYEADTDLVKLEQELLFLQEYIALQKLRTPSNTRITFAIKGQTQNTKIAPLILLPFIENAFKHGIKGAITTPFIDVELHVQSSHITFSVINNLGEASEIGKDDYGGIGLKNIKRRLNLKYPDRHDLIIESREDIFRINLKLQL